ncbi:hypothetical protein MYAM1_003471 [Malassezia yamatoensis]|uniref:triacylglycerol lipase n=1 Tax=Malassezia yamatoensis TaxID=253288 RepID=A0AAJ5YWS0_9BASI|nr:hypothetical protein MYAM1_003471 [Malassezia yamatoensis]
MLFNLVLAFFAFAQYALAATHSLERRVKTLSPSNDPFYQPPSGWEDKQPGDILRERKVNLAFLEVDEYKYKEAYQLLYRTTGAYENEPSHTVTTVIVPHNATSNQLVNYLIYTDANGARCAPSYTMRLGGRLANDLSLTYQQLLLGSYLDQGYIMTIPDYQGPTRGFAAGRMEGRMSLDGIRATLNFERLGLKKHTKVVSHGYSGGAIASGWSAALHPSYASEINAVGFSMGGTPANLSSTVESLDGGLFAAFALTGIAGIVWTYPEVMKSVKSRFTEKGETAFSFARSHCMYDALLKFPLSRLLSNDFIKGGKGLLHEPEVKAVVQDLVLGLKKNETPTAPVYMYHGQHDEVIPYNDAAKAARQWAHRGADVLFQDYTDVASGHVVSELLSIPNILFFARDRFQGKSFAKGYKRKTSYNGLDDIHAAAQGLQSLVSAIQDLIGKKVGEGDSLLQNDIKQHAN